MQYPRSTPPRVLEPLKTFKLTCSREQLSSELGPPDFFPLVPGCPEDLLTAETLTNGYKESAEEFGVTEASESALSLTCDTTHWDPRNVVTLRQTIFSRLRAAHKFQISHRRGASYGVPLTIDPLASLLAVPEVHPVPPDKLHLWLKDLAGDLPLRHLAEQVPEGLTRADLFQALWQYDIPLIRAAWLIKVQYWHLARTSKPSSPSSPTPPPPGPSFMTPSIAQQCSEEFTLHLMQQLEKSLGLTRAGAASTPPGGPGTPGTQDGGRGSPQGMEGYSQRPLLGPPSPPDSSCKLNQEEYFIRLGGYTICEGLVHASLFLEWVIGLLLRGEKPQDPWALGEVVSMAALCVQCLPTTPQLSCKVLDNILEYTTTTLIPLAMSPGPPSEELSSLIIACRELVRELVATTPDALLTLDSLQVVPRLFNIRLADGATAREPRTQGLLLGKGEPKLEASGRMVEDLYEQFDNATNFCDVVGTATYAQAALPLPLGSAEEDGDQDVNALLARQRALSLAVSPQLLNHSEREEFAAMDKAFLTGDVKAAYSQLQSFMGTRMEYLQEAVNLVCSWGVADPVSLMQEALLPQSEERGVTRNGMWDKKRWFVVRLCISLLRDVAAVSADEQGRPGHSEAEKRMGKPEDGAGATKAKGPPKTLLLHPYIASWMDTYGGDAATLGGVALLGTPTLAAAEVKIKNVDSMEEGEVSEISKVGLGGVRASAGPSMMPPPTHHAEVKRVMRLVVALSDVGFFSPALYLKQLVILGVLSPPLGAPLEAHQRAARHKRYLRHLHPQLLRAGPPVSHPPLSSNKPSKRSRSLSPSPMILGDAPSPAQDEGRKSEPSGKKSENPTKKSESSSKKRKADLQRMQYAVMRKAALDSGPSISEAEGHQMRGKRRRKNDTLEDDPPGQLRLRQVQLLCLAAIGVLAPVHVRGKGAKQIRLQEGDMSGRRSAEPETPGLSQSPGDWPPPEKLEAPGAGDRHAKGRAWQDTGVADMEALSSVSIDHLPRLCQTLRPWEQSCLSEVLCSQIQEQLRLAGVHLPLLNPSSTANVLSTKDSLSSKRSTTPGAPIPSGNQSAWPCPSCPEHLSALYGLGNLWLQRCVTLLVASNACNAAMQLLVGLLKQWVADLASQGPGGDSSTGIKMNSDSSTVGEKLHVTCGTLVACLQSLHDRLAALSWVPSVLDLCTSWSCHWPSRSIGRQVFSDVIALAGYLLAVYGDVPAVQQWWAQFSGGGGGPEGQQGARWLVEDLQLYLPAFKALGEGGAAATGGPGGLAQFNGILSRSEVQRLMEKHSKLINAEDVAQASSSGSPSLREFGLAMSRLVPAAKVTGPQGVDKASLAGLTKAVASNLASFVVGQGDQGSQAPGGMHVDQDRLWVVIVGVLRQYVKVVGAVGNGEEADEKSSGELAYQLAPRVVVVVRQMYTQLLVAFRQALHSSSVVRLEPLVPSMLLAACLLLMREMPSEPSRPGSGLGRSGKGRTSSSGQEISKVKPALVTLLLTASSGGLLYLPDVVRMLTGAESGAALAPVKHILLGDPSRHEQLALKRVPGVDPSFMSQPLDFGQAVLFQALQEQLPFEMLYQTVVEECLLPVVVLGDKASSYQVLLAKELALHPPIRHNLLKDPRIYARLCSTSLVSAHWWPDGRLPKSLSSLPSRLVAQSLIMGKLQTVEMVGDVDYCKVLYQLLCSLSPATFDLHWLMVRLLLDERAFITAQKNERKGLKEALEVVSPSGPGDRRSVEPTALDKEVCDVVLAVLLVHPAGALCSGDLTWQLGRGLGEHLLMRIDWILQDRCGDRSGDLLLGYRSLPQLLSRITHNLAGGGGHRVSGGGGPFDLAPQDYGVQTGRGGPFAVEYGLAQMALNSLKQSPPVRQREFAAEVVRQITRIAEVAKKLPEGWVGHPPPGPPGPLVQQNSGLVPNQPPGAPPALTNPGGAEGEAPDAHQGNARKRSFGGFGGGRRRGGGSSSGGAADASGSGGSPLVGSPAAIQVSLWTRLYMLMPLLPIVYADREPDPRKNLRALLAGALLQLVASPCMRGPLDPGLGEQDMIRRAISLLQENGGRPEGQVALWDIPSRADGSDGGRLSCDGEASTTSVDAVALSAEYMAGEPLMDRLLAIVAGLLSGTWASWLRGNQKKLREVPAFDATQLQADLEAMPSLPVAVRARIQSVLPTFIPPRIYAGTSADALPAGQQPVPPQVAHEGDGEPIWLNPWVPYEGRTGLRGGFCLGGARAADEEAQETFKMLQGSIPTSRGDLLYLDE